MVDGGRWEWIWCELSFPNKPEVFPDLEDGPLLLLALSTHFGGG